MQTWLKFKNDTDEEPTHTANIFSEDDGVRIEWWNEDVGVVSTVYAPSIQNAERWLTDHGFTDFTA